MAMSGTNFVIDLREKGYAVIPGILTEAEIDEAKQQFTSWRKSIPNHDFIHSACDPHGIYKFHEAGHQRHAWNIRTNPKVQEVFKMLWKTDDLIVSFDGSCYIPKEWKKQDKIWTHTDQCPDKNGLECYQGFVALTENKERTFMVYEGSHLLHEKYFKDREITGTNNWQLIEHSYLDEIQDRKRILHVPAGAMVLWDSRSFHQNRYGKPESEERMVQYVCYLPRNHRKNTKAIQTKREKYFTERRTTSHWPCPVHVNSKQPVTYGNANRLIDYGVLTRPDLEDLMPEIKKIL
jgi:hypothetical protein